MLVDDGAATCSGVLQRRLFPLRLTRATATAAAARLETFCTRSEILPRGLFVDIDCQRGFLSSTVLSRCRHRIYQHLSSYFDSSCSLVPSAAKVDVFLLCISFDKPERHAHYIRYYSIEEQQVPRRCLPRKWATRPTLSHDRYAPSLSFAVRRAQGDCLLFRGVMQCMATVRLFISQLCTLQRTQL